MKGGPCPTSQSGHVAGDDLSRTWNDRARLRFLAGPLGCSAAPSYLVHVADDLASKEKKIARECRFPFSHLHPCTSTVLEPLNSFGLATIFTSGFS